MFRSKWFSGPALRDLASEKGVSIAALAAKIDSARGDANLSSALRVYVLKALLDKAERPAHP